MEQFNLLLFAVMLMASTHATGEEHAPTDARPAFATSSSAPIADENQPAAIGQETTPTAALNLTLPREASSYRTPLPDQNPQRQAWCVQQSQIRPESTGFSEAGARRSIGCYDRGVALSGREFLIGSALELTVRKAVSIFSN